MTRSATAQQLVTLVVIVVAGLAAGVYILAHQSSGLPRLFSDTYRIHAELTNASGVRPSVGQPVNVAGVRVGQIAGVRAASSGNAVLDLVIERDQLPAVYTNARAHLEPITPLEDLLLNLEPGAPPAGKVPDGGLIDVATTTSPAELSTLLNALDGDTRTFMRTLISSLGVGTRGQGESMRQALVALGPTTAQVGELSRSLAARRRELARAVTNLATVAHAASRDDRLADVVRAGNQTLAAINGEDAALRESLAKIPRSIDVADRMLERVAALADEVRPAVSALRPATKRLPGALDDIRPFAQTAEPVLRRDVRPLVREARPLAGDLGSAVPGLAAIAPRATNALKSLTYFLNEMAYNPPGSDEGALSWHSWAFHNWASFTSNADAHGNIGNVVPFVACDPVNSAAVEVETLINALSGLSQLCPSR